MPSTSQLEASIDMAFDEYLSIYCHARRFSRAEREGQALSDFQGDDVLESPLGEVVKRLFSEISARARKLAREGD